MSENAPAPNSDTSMSSPGDSPVKIYRKPGSEPDSMGIARAFGLSSPVLLAKFDHDTWSPRTCQASLLCPEQWESLQGSWPDSAMWDLTSVYELRTSERAILGNESSSWPTPNTRDHHPQGPRVDYPQRQTNLPDVVKTWPTARREDGESAGNHPGATDSLTGATRNWTTPTATERSGQGERNKARILDVKNWMTPHGMHGTDHTGKTGRGGEFAAQATQWRTPDAPGKGGPRNRQGSIGAGHQTTIGEQAEHWQTPATDSFRSRGGDRKDEIGLDQQARFFPTPAQRDYRTPNKKSYQDRGGETKGEQLQNFVAHSLPDQTIPDGPPSLESGPTSRRQSTSKKRLNPRFVAWLLGFPPNWCEL